MCLYLLGMIHKQLHITVLKVMSKYFYINRSYVQYLCIISDIHKWKFVMIRGKFECDITENTHSALLLLLRFYIFHVKALKTNFKSMSIQSQPRIEEKGGALGGKCTVWRFK